MSPEETELAERVLKNIRMWMHGYSQCVTLGEQAVCKSTMHHIQDMVFDFDEAQRAKAAIVG